MSVRLLPYIVILNSVWCVSLREHYCRWLCGTVLDLHTHTHTSGCESMECRGVWVARSYSEISGVWYRFVDEFHLSPAASTQGLPPPISVADRCR
jgi:hypothetical protein